MGLMSNLTAGEILEQLYFANKVESIRNGKRLQQTADLVLHVPTCVGNCPLLDGIVMASY
jgi:hypothetical protein